MERLKRNWIFFVVLISLISVFAACATQTQGLNTSEEVIVGGIKAVCQADNMGCTPACLEMAMKYYGINISQEAIAKTLKTSPFYGTKWGVAIPFIKSQGFGVQFFTAENRFAQIDYHLRRGEVVIAQIKNPNSRISHSILIIGLGRDKLYFIDPAHPSISLSQMSVREFSDINKGYRCFAILKSAP